MGTCSIFSMAGQIRRSGNVSPPMGSRDRALVVWEQSPQKLTTYSENNAKYFVYWDLWQHLRVTIAQKHFTTFFFGGGGEGQVPPPLAHACGQPCIQQMLGWSSHCMSITNASTSTVFVISISHTTWLHMMPNTFCKNFFLYKIILYLTHCKTHRNRTTLKLPWWHNCFNILAWQSPIVVKI